MKIKLEELSKPKNIPNISIIITALIISLFILKGISDLWVKNTALKNDTLKKTAEIKKGLNIPVQKETINSEIIQLNTRLFAIEEKFSSNTEDIFSSLNRSAEGSEIRLASISPSDKNKINIPDTKDAYLELPIKISIECGYDQLLSFLNKIETAEKVILVNDVKIQNNPGNVWEHKIELSLKVPVSK